MEPGCHSFVKNLSNTNFCWPFFLARIYRTAFKIGCNPSKRGGLWVGEVSVTLFLLVKFGKREIIRKEFSSPPLAWDAQGCNGERWRAVFWMQPSQRAKVALLQPLPGGSQHDPALRPPVLAQPLGLLHISTSPHCRHCSARLFPPFPWCGESQRVNLVNSTLSEIAGHDCIAGPHSREMSETVFCCPSPVTWWIQHHVTPDTSFLCKKSFLMQADLVFAASRLLTWSCCILSIELKSLVTPVLAFAAL